MNRSFNSILRSIAFASLIAALIGAALTGIESWSALHSSADHPQFDDPSQLFAQG